MDGALKDRKLAKVVVFAPDLRADKLLFIVVFPNEAEDLDLKKMFIN
jgi:hypothetical protein